MVACMVCCAPGHLVAAGGGTNQEVYQTGTWRHGPLQYSLDEAIMSRNQLKV